MLTAGLRGYLSLTNKGRFPLRACNGDVASRQPEVLKRELRRQIVQDIVTAALGNRNGFDRGEATWPSRVEDERCFVQALA